MSIDYVLGRLDALEAQIKGHCENHPLEHHDHLLDPEEHAAHHARSEKPQEPTEKRAGERRQGGTHEGEERRGGVGRRKGEEKAAEAPAPPAAPEEQRPETEPDRRHPLHKKVGGRKAA